MADAVKSGILALIHVDGTAVGGMVDASVSIDGKPIDVTNKDDSQWETYLGGRTSWSMTGNGFIMMDSVDGTIEAQWKALWTAVTTSAAVTVKFIFPTGTGNTFFTGSGYVTNLGVDGPDNEGFAGSFSVQGTGALTLTEAT